ncbi:hypothetical protein VZT92_026510 [Zoarces viviparus]|uniref:Uncharacterized protein n=1 Tax=Zoarces viviparus TaxID=48416 RepID=A0AAW1E082_ZOAVI
MPKQSNGFWRRGLCSLANVLRPDSPERAGLRDDTEANPHCVPQPVSGRACRKQAEIGGRTRRGMPDVRRRIRRCRWQVDARLYSVLGRFGG